VKRSFRRLGRDAAPGDSLTAVVGSWQFRAEDFFGSIARLKKKRKPGFVFGFSMGVAYAHGRGPEIRNSPLKLTVSAAGNARRIAAPLRFCRRSLRPDQ